MGCYHLAVCLLGVSVWSGGFLGAAETSFSSHPPTRPLPVPSARPLSHGHGVYVDGKNGNDANSGTRESPWRTLAYAVKQLEPGHVLYLRGGTYYEHITIDVQGTREKPITIRSVPGELVVIDGGLREFFDSPTDAWEPVPDGVPGEFRSVKSYPELGGRDGSTNVLGNFGDSLIPLHGYRYLSDLRSSNEYFAKLGDTKTNAGDGVYCGPGLFYDVATERIHCRLAHTKQPALATDNYTGETDPRKLPLVIAGINAGSPLSLEGTRFLKVQDVVIRGARMATVSISNCRNIEFDGVTAYGGSSAFSVRNTGGLRVWNCALRGIAAPWTFRGSLKYRAIEARIFSASGWQPTGQDNHDFELAYSEFTDCVDGVFIGNVRNVRFHHNLMDNLSDDGIFLTARTAYDGTTPGGNVSIYQNRFARCLTTFAFGVGHGRQKMTEHGRQTGAGVSIYRNIFDFRRPVMYQQPGENATELPSFGRIMGDHGGPLWEPMTIYHNTILQAEPPFRSYYLGGMGGHLAGGSMRRVFNNLLVQVEGAPGHVLPPVTLPQTEETKAPVKPKPKKDPLDDLLDQSPLKTKPSKNRPGDLKLGKAVGEEEKVPKAPLPIDFQADANLQWSYGTKPTEELFQRFRNSPEYENSKKLYASGWTTHDVIADPWLQSFDADWKSLVDLRLPTDSPAIDAGVPLPRDWSDPLREGDKGRPDLGAASEGIDPWRVGMRGRLTVFGGAVSPDSAPSPAGFLLEGVGQTNSLTASKKNKPAVMVQGYPAFDAPLIAFALRKAGATFENLERTWLPPSDYDQFGLVIVVGDLRRAKIEPDQYSPNDLKHVGQFLKTGGTLMLMRGNHSLFATPHGSEFLENLTGGNRRIQADSLEILKPRHEWLQHLKAKPSLDWINVRHAQPLKAKRGEIVIGHPAGLATLYRLPVGKGRLIYVGWDVAASLPNGRNSSTVKQETSYEAQMQVLQNIINSLTQPIR